MGEPTQEDGPSKREVRRRREGLYALMSRELEPGDVAEFWKQVKGEEHPRGAALLIACNLELALDMAMQPLFVQDRRSQLYGPNKALGTFANKIALAYALGLFDEETLANLELIKTIRNVFAHCQAPVTFETKEIAAAVACLKPPVPVPPRTTSSDRAHYEAKTGRERYASTCDNIGHNILWGSRPVRRAGPPDEDAARDRGVTRQTQLTFASLP